jgi:hypothetical protein
LAFYKGSQTLLVWGPFFILAVLQSSYSERWSTPAGKAARAGHLFVYGAPAEKNSICVYQSVDLKNIPIYPMA